MSDNEVLGRMTIDELKVLIGTKFSDDDLAPFTGKALAKAFIIEGPVQARLVEQILEQEGIPFLIQSYRDTAYDGIFTGVRGWGAVITREEDGAKLSEVIQTVLDTQYEGEGEDDDDGQAEE